MKSLFSAISKRRNPVIVSLGLTVFLAFGALSHAAIPPAERILPNDTLFVMSAPDFSKLRTIYKSNPQNLFWNDPAMKPFKDKFMAKFKEEVVTPLERELGVTFKRLHQSACRATHSGRDAKRERRQRTGRCTFDGCGRQK